MIIRETEKWRIELDAEEETDSPDMTFDWTVSNRAEVFEKINNGTWLWFEAKVSVIHKPTELTLGTDYLFGCLYESLEQFAQPGGYVRSMTSAAISEARNNMERITT